MRIQVLLGSKLIICFSVLLFSCNTTEKQESNFIEKFGRDNFSVFRGRSVFIRGFSKEKYPIIFISDSHDSVNGPIVITFDKKKKKVVDFGTQFIRTIKIIDTLEIINIVNRFIHYPISYIKVDSINNVYVGLKPNQGPSLFFSSDDIDLSIRDSNLLLLNNGWYRIRKRK